MIARKRARRGAWIIVAGSAGATLALGGCEALLDTGSLHDWGADGGGADGAGPDSTTQGDSGPGDGGASGDAGGDAGSDTSTSVDGGSDGSGTTLSDAEREDAGDGACASSCSADLTTVVNCRGTVSQTCASTDLCDPSTLTCAAACQVAASLKGSLGCDFYATDMEELNSANDCFAAYVVNASSAPAHISADFAGTALTVASFAAIPSGVGPSITYAAYNPTTGLPPGQAAILFLAGSTTAATPCPTGVTPAMATGAFITGTGTGSSFHISTDVAVTAYEMNPYGGGIATVPGASMLLPTSAWGTNYSVVTAAPAVTAFGANPSLNIVAMQDSTQITLLPSAAIVGGGTLPAGTANTVYSFTLNAGQQAQLSQPADLSGSILQSSAPVGLMAGNACMQTPVGTNYCDHGEQMLPPVQALGSDYAAVMFRPRVTGDEAIWRVVGLVAGTALTYSSPVAAAPVAVNNGQVFEFQTAQPFEVSSQDSAHPFALFARMTGGTWTGLSDTSGYGDPDFVVAVPTAQFQTSYAFYADPTFPEDNLVVVRAKDPSNAFDDVTLDCSGVVTGWQTVGAYEWTRVDLLRHEFAAQGSCSAGPHVMSSNGPFGVTVWGWGSPETTTNTTYVSYGYPAGAGGAAINSVVLSPTP